MTWIVKLNIDVVKFDTIRQKFDIYFIGLN